MILVLGQEIKSGEKSGRVREKTGSQLDLAGQGARRQAGGGCLAGVWGVCGAGCGSSPAGQMPPESREHWVATSSSGAAALGF